jgi:hypothetical protein
MPVVQMAVPFLKNQPYIGYAGWPAFAINEQRPV